jgi:hypothetical protein
VKTELRVTARVQSGHKLEIISPELEEGDEVAVVVTKFPDHTPSSEEDGARLVRHLLDIGAIPSLPGPRRCPNPPLLFVSGEPVSETIIEERR